MKICTVIGARPQFIKAAVISRAINNFDNLSEVLIHTGQHFDANMSDVFFEELNIPRPRYNLKIGGGTHGQNTGRMLEEIEKVLLEEKPDWVLVYGDTDSTLAGALAAVKLHIPVAHVEAGLRSFNRRMPEEINRILTDHAATIMFAPTETAVKNLKQEGIPDAKVHNVGDVMYDATIFYKDKAKPPLNLPRLDRGFVLCTIHRADSTDNIDTLKNIFKAFNKIAETVDVIMPIHPRTAGVIKRNPEITIHDKVHLFDPVGYLEMNWLLSNCKMVMTDSGGLQKEAYFHKKRCVTLRSETEWIELVEADANTLVDPNSPNISVVVLDSLKTPIINYPQLYGAGDGGYKILEIITNQKSHKNT